MLQKLKTILKWLLTLVCVTILILIGIKLAQQNQEPVGLKLIIWQLPEASAGEVFGVTLLLGVVIGIVASLPGYLAQKFKIRSLRRKIRRLEQHPSPASLPKAD